MNRTRPNHRPNSKPGRALPGALAALALGFSIGFPMSSHAAGGGEALDIELPSMRTPVEATAAPAVVQAATDPAYEAIAASAAPRGPLTRAQVRESLKMARLSNTMTPSGEIGDTPQVLQAREDFNALQTEVLQAEYAAAAARGQQVAMALRAPGAEGDAVLVEEQQIVVAPEMTVGELMSFLQDSRAEGTVHVVLPNPDETEED